MKDNQAEKLINIRPTVIAAGSAVIGVLSAYGVYKADVSPLFVVLIVIIAALPLFILFSADKKLLIFVAAAILFFFAGFASFGIQFSRFYTDSPDFREVTVRVRANRTLTVNEGYVSGFFNDIEILSEDTLSVSEGLEGSVQAEFYLIDASEDISEGDLFLLKGVIYRISAYRDGVDCEQIDNNALYRMKVEQAEHLGHTVPTFFESVRKYIKAVLFENMQRESAAVATALIIGDTDELSKTVKESYRITGLAHLFSVSGLHIGFASALVALLTGELSKKHRFIGFFIKASVIWLYTAICGFPPSAVRAAITATAVCFFYPHRRIEPISGLALAAAVLVIANPSTLFNGGCYMSFSAVFGIITVAPTITRAFGKGIKSPFIRKLIGAFAVSLGASVGTLPFVAEYYGELSLLSIPINMIAVGVMTSVFVMTTVCLLPIVCKLLFIPSFIISLMNKLIEYASEARVLSLGDLAAIPIICIVLFLVLLLLGGFINLGKKPKLAAVSVLLACATVASIAFPNISRENSLIKRDEALIIASESGAVFVYADARDEYDAYTIKRALKGLSGSDIYFITDSFPLTTTEAGVRSLLKEISVKGVITSDMREHDAAMRFKASGIDVSSEFIGGGIHIFAAEVNGHKFIIAENGSHRLAIIRSFGKLKYSEIVERYGSLDLIYAVRASAQNTEECGCIVITESLVQSGNCISTAFIGDFTFKNGYDIIKERSSRAKRLDRFDCGEAYAFFGA